MDTSVGYRTKGVYASPLKWSPGSRSPRAVSDIRGGHRASHGPKLHVAQRDLEVDEALNRLTRASLVRGSGKLLLA